MKSDSIPHPQPPAQVTDDSTLHDLVSALRLVDYLDAIDSELSEQIEPALRAGDKAIFKLSQK